MKFTITNPVGEQTEIFLTNEEAKRLGIPEHMIPKLTGYERMPFGERYWFFNGDSVIDLMEDGAVVDGEYYDSANYYSSADLAWANFRADKLMRQLRQHAALHGGIPSRADWKSGDGVEKFCIAHQQGYTYDDKDALFVECYNRECFVGNVYFLSREACQRAIEIFRDELVWYFNEYEAMLYED